MERLTGRRDGRTYIVGCPDFALPKIAGLIIQQTVDRLATIEDILGDEYDLDELSKAMAALRREHQKGHNATWYDIGASGAHCSRCHYWAPQQSRYCPHCGAKMERREKP